MNIALIILYTILIILILIIIILYIGLKIDLKFNYNKEFKGLINISLIGIKIYKKEIPVKNKEDEKEDNKTNINNKNLIKEVIRNRNEIKKILKILKENSKYKTEGKLIFGFDSPVNTAEIAGILWGLTSIFNNNNFNIQIEPVFNKETIEFEFKMNININLLVFIIKTLNIIRKEPMKTFIKNTIKNLRGT
ncbi:hypothetical protein BGI41_07920 [Methanobrevibacter sp. 87.7]|uniref:DUF2953 domain-containing protein n=1 Tax=Methanobrevibacter sp. 87.7 TaxID=387957 RepID=UPI000B6D7182|nr:DUF2953 domain-containing protein [Methanobrevibacter sp. 87.7]OWT32387.1 hypothetical protein BGI41_07920 [Methanobrevibacter sp. 87.7]